MGGEAAAIDWDGRSEWQRIEQWRRLAGPARRPPGLVLGIGDDAAVLRPGPADDWVVTQDALVEDVHFRRAWTTPEDLAYKVLAVSVSDIAAMAARPRFAFVSLALPDDCDAPWSDAFARGLGRAARRLGLSLAGGDTVRSPAGLFVDGVVIGRVARGCAVLRSGARPGDRLVLTGSVGGAAAGLRLFERPALAAGLPGPLVRSAQGRLLRPRPRVAEGAALGASAHALVDLSDGLAGAVEALVRGRALGVDLWRDAIPLHRAVTPVARRLGLDPVAFAVAGGEDYELLAARSPDEPDGPGLRLRQIGVVTKGPGAWLVGGGGGRSPLPLGYDAFRPAER